MSAMMHVERREFLLDMAKVAGGLVCMGGLAGLAGCSSELTEPAVKNPPGVPASYDTRTLLEQFDKALPAYRRALAAMGRDAGDEVVREAAADYRRTMRAVPYVGDVKYPLPETLVQSAVALSFYRAMRSLGASGDKAEEFIYEAGAANITSGPAAEMQAAGAYQFTEQWYEMQRMLSARSQEKRLPGDWAYSFVEGVPGEFDWGWDFTECGIVKLYKPNGELRLVRQMCRLDFVASECQGTGLRRKTTLASGGSKCDFRYKQGREAVST